MKKYNQPPIQLDGDFPIKVDEMMLYQYLPIKMAYEFYIPVDIPIRLRVFSHVVETALLDYVRHVDFINDKYVYVSAKHMFVMPGQNLNRLGWHSDGFGTDDVSYIWSNCLPTIWTDGRPSPPTDDSAALSYFNASENIPVYRTEANKIYRLDQYVVHACDVATEPTLRAFIKINISKDKYDLIGNSKNYLIDYDWEMKPRKAERNHPQSETNVL